MYIASYKITLNNITDKDYNKKNIYNMPRYDAMNF